MEIWADATKDVVNALDAGDGNVNIDFPLGILNRNTTIPVLLTDDDGNILQHRNFNLPGPVDPLGGFRLSTRHSLKETGKAFVHIERDTHSYFRRCGPAPLL